jgi:dihydrofolate reductase
MARLVYSAITSLDGYVEDEHGRFEWGEPDDEVLRVINELERPIGTYLYGRRMYETMVFWETAPLTDEQPAAARDFTEIWQAADKVVYSRTLQSVASARTRLEPAFDPDAVRRLKASSERDLSIGGAELAGAAIAAGLVDELHLFLCPVVLGGGKPALAQPVRSQLTLRESTRFGGGVAHLHYELDS